MKQPTAISSIPSLFILEPVSSKWGVWNGYTVSCINFQDGHSILNTDAKKTPGLSYVRDPYHHDSITIGWETLLHKLTQNLVEPTGKGMALATPLNFESVKSSSPLCLSNTWLTKTELCINI